MTDADAAKEEARIMAVIDRWREPVLPGGYEMTYCFYRESIPEHDDANATCESHWQYLHAALEFNLSRVQDMTDEKLEYLVLHELAHIYVNPCRPIGEDWTVEMSAREEFAASTIANSWLWTRDHFQKEHSAAVAEAS